MSRAVIKVLSVDDEDDFILTREFFSEVKGQKYDLKWASSYEALEVIGQREHDVYLFDYRLGGRTGLELLKQAQADGSSVPVILLTGQSEHEFEVMQHRFLDLNEVISNVMRMLQRFLGEHIALEFHPTSKLPSIYGDTGMIEQVLMNLAVNARDAMPKGGRLIVRTSLRKFENSAALLNAQAREGDIVCLSVIDSGCGIDEKTLNRIFEPFFTTKEVGKGTGLGLATVYGIVQQHQGWVEAESQIGLGTTFNIFLPATASKLSPKLSLSSKHSAQGGEETILVVEDEPALRLLVVEILKLYGYRVFDAASGLLALDVWKEHKGKIDLLLTDMVMPDGISGRELAERLLKEQPNLKVIYTSGYSPGMAGKDTALLTGFNFLPKPYPPSRLAEVVRSCLNNEPQHKKPFSSQC